MDTGIDFHTHILPNMDDGAASAEISLQLLSALRSQGVNTMVLTPHYYSHREALPAFLERREVSTASLLTVLQQTEARQALRLVLGCEVFLSEYLFNNSDLSPICIGETRYMLVEFRHGMDLGKRDVEHIERLIDVYGIVPVLAHVERYNNLIYDTRLIDELLSMGCLFQSNLSSFSRFGALRHQLIKLVQQQRLHLVGTDCHNMENRTPSFADNWNKLQRLAGPSPARALSDRAAAILSDAQLLVG